MARILTCGFEIDGTSGAEFMSAGGAAVAYAAVARSGDRSLRINGMSSGVVSGVVGRFAVTADSGPYYVRFAFRVDTAPSAANTICGFSSSTNLGLTFSNRPHIRLNADRTLAAWVNDAQLGSASPALTLGKWHEIQQWWDCSPAVGSRVYRCYLDGVEWAGTSTSSMNVFTIALSFQVGGNLLGEAQTAGDWLFDDLAINDGTGGDQNGLPPSGRVVCMFPDSAGDSNGWNNTANSAGSTNNYTLVDENPPDDGSSLVQSNTLNAADLYNLDSSGLGTDDTINCVQVYDRHRNNTTDAVTSYALQIEKTSGGTKTQGATVTPNSTTWRTGSGSGSTVAPWASLTTYLDPDGAAWTTSTVNSMQVGPKLTGTGTNRCQVSTVWASVDYTPAPARRWYLANEAADYTPATKRGAWDDSAATLARKLSYTPSGAATTAAVAETSSTNDWDVLVGRWISDGATVAGTLSGYLNWVIGAGESDAAANMVWHAHVYVTAGDSDTVRGTLRADYVGSAEWPTTASGRSAVNIAVTSTAISVGDRIVLELGYRAQNTATTSYTGTIHYGNTGVADLRSTATTVTVDPGWVEIVGAEDIWDPDVVPGGDDTASPAAVATTTTVPAASVSAGATASPAAVVTSSTLPAASPSAGATASPASVASAATVPAATVTAASTVAATAVASAATLPAATVTAGGSATANATTVASTAALPAATVGAGATTAPAAVATAATLPQATLSAGASASPAAVATSAALPSATTTAGSTATPAAVASTTAMPAPSVTAGGAGTASPPTVATAATVPQAGRSAGASTTPASVATGATLPGATVGAGGAAHPAAIASATALPAAGPTAGSSRTPASVATTSTVPAATARAGATATPVTLTVVSAIPAASVTAGAGATATPQPVAALASVLTATVTGGVVATPAAVATVATIPAVQVTTPGRLIHPPDEGSVSRPSTGTIVRPNTGVIYQP